MKVYVVAYQGYDDCEDKGVYSTRELAEASWEIRNQGPYGEYGIEEFELDLDPKASELDIDRRPFYGPKTRVSHLMTETFKNATLNNLMAKTPIPTRTGKEIKFFSYEASKTPENGI